MFDVEADNKFLLDLGDGGLNPSDAEVAMAPYITDWFFNRFFTVFTACMIGEVIGHPELDDGPVTTTPLGAADLKRGWVMTRNRIYRLGRHRGDRDE